MLNRRSTSGFTLVELMIIVVLLGVVAAVALPSFSQLVSGNRTQSAASELTALLQFSRESALTRRAAATVCLDDSTVWFVSPGNQCDQDNTLRTMEVAAGVQVATSDDSLVFRHNGSAPEQTIVLCHDEDFANGYTLTIQSSGLVRSSKRGQTADEQPMSSCEP